MAIYFAYVLLCNRFGDSLLLSTLGRVPFTACDEIQHKEQTHLLPIFMVACAAQDKADGSATAAEKADGSPRLQPASMHRIRKNTQKGASGCTIENKFKAKCPLLD